MTTLADTPCITLTGPHILDPQDVSDIARIAGIECHYALMRNSNPSHPTQQDRASVHALPGVAPEQFTPLIQETFKRMYTRHADILRRDGTFGGNSTATVMMFDPLTGKLAIGSKGDSATYLLLQDKAHKKPPIIKRISTPYEGYDRYTTLCISNVPLMWAQQDDWGKVSSSVAPTYALDTRRPQSDYKDYTPPALIDLKALAHDILKKEKGLRYTFKRLCAQLSGASLAPPKLEDYELSIISGSDGLLSGDEHIPTRLQRIALAASQADAGKNLAGSALLAAIKAPLSDLKSKDNLSAIVLRDIRFGVGDVAISTCICDGNYREIPAHGNQAAQAMIEVYDALMERTRNESLAATTSRHASQLEHSRATQGPQLP